MDFMFNTVAMICVTVILMFLITCLLPEKRRPNIIKDFCLLIKAFNLSKILSSYSNSNKENTDEDVP